MLKLLIAAVTALIALPVLLGALATGSSTTAPAHVDGIGDRLLQAYTTAAAGDCPGMRWQILAGIGHVESDLAAGHDIAPDGDVTPPVIGPRLDGSGAGGNTTPHYDTDNGKWDHDTEYDRAVGPNQHLPSGWDDYGADGNDDGIEDPHNADDSALASGRELCFSAGAGGTDFTDRTQLAEALYRYNHSDEYVDDVLAAIDRFDQRAPDLGEQPGGDRGQTAVAWAMDQVGKPYVWGGTGPDGFDCSGLVMRAWQAAGVDIPRVTTDQYTAGTWVERTELAPGDLLFYDLGAPGAAPTHVTMYAGDGEMINAPSTGQTVRVQPVESPVYANRYMGAVRPQKQT
ncbi:C40 family peptidase [Streptomonospora salina]|uniref:Cell wall-associated NlpC family hydrolase n=1 Tax=Streptomonospora salina TaxID=104205 RepID=A0A841EKY5_9ACTN|nr:C40 family peptidase [Streptomonospora salina]MBB6000071.1 cell wall-associated NlpC family hydrolase [Streptomonospora salina]